MQDLLDEQKNKEVYGKKYFTVRADAEMVQKIEKIAEKSLRSRNAVVKVLLEFALTDCCKCSECEKDCPRKKMERILASLIEEEAQGEDE